MQKGTDFACSIRLLFYLGLCSSALDLFVIAALDFFPVIPFCFTVSWGQQPGRIGSMFVLGL